jgi:hypothetical protein
VNNPAQWTLDRNRAGHFPVRRHPSTLPLLPSPSSFNQEPP